MDVHHKREFANPQYASSAAFIGGDVMYSAS